MARLDLGIVYFEAGKYKESLAELSAAAKLMPDDVDVHWRLGRLYRKLGRTDEAKMELEKASKLNKAADLDLASKIERGRSNSAPPAPPAEK